DLRAHVDAVGLRPAKMLTEKLNTRSDARAIRAHTGESGSAVIATTAGAQHAQHEPDELERGAHLPDELHHRTLSTFTRHPLHFRLPPTLSRTSFAARLFSYELPSLRDLLPVGEELCEPDIRQRMLAQLNEHRERTGCDVGTHPCCLMN